eukprot:TRINITY_DN4032_c0_g1_i2.p1 TRINITY_DN4032_c0_g1~~TRINITY_DN4032_c0_g1_i2.p1  ORF type:complete len:167 (+),score=40.29 TRINITY_DN4032_c0_g1_i2:42-503(+)
MSQADEKIGRVEVDVGPYRWSQSVDEVSITIILSPGIRGKDISCKITANKLFLQIKGQSPIFDGTLFERVNSEDSCWTIDQQELNITLVKQKKHQVWDSIIEGLNLMDPMHKDKVQRNLMLQKFQMETPGFDFSGAEFTGNVPSDPANFGRFD